MLNKSLVQEQEDKELKKLVTSQGVGSTFVKEAVTDVARSYRDDLAKIRDDPLFAIKQQEKKVRERILDNPLKIAEFKKELDEKRKRKAEKKDAKKAKKVAKKEAKSHRHRSSSPPISRSCASRLLADTVALFSSLFLSHFCSSLRLTVLLSCSFAHLLSSGPSLPMWG
jgi:hypothetical protein